jgi:hypothetical protein
MAHAACHVRWKFDAVCLRALAGPNRLSRSAICKYASFRAILVPLLAGGGCYGWVSQWWSSYSQLPLTSSSMRSTNTASRQSARAACSLQHATCKHTTCNMQQLYAKVSLMADPCKERPPVPIPRGQHCAAPCGLRARLSGGGPQAAERLTARLCMRRSRLRSRRHAALSSGARG